MITGKEYLKKHIGETNIPEEHYENEIGEMMDWYADYYHQEQVKNLNIADVISCFLKETKESNKDKYSKITIQMRDNELQVQGHNAIPYGQSWGKWLIDESSALNNL